MHPDKQILQVGGMDLPFAKQYYTKPAVMANYTREIAEMFQVISSLKPIDEEPIPASKNESLYAKADRIVKLEQQIAQITADPDQSSKVEVCFEIGSAEL